MKRVVVGFIFDENKLLLIKHKRKNMWLPVGGHAEENETDEEALKREIKEEIGVDVEILGESFYIMKEPGEITPHYLCNLIGKNIKVKKDEILEFKWFTKEDIEIGDLNKRIKKLSLIAFEKLKKK